MEKVFYALIGVVVGILLTWLKDWLTQKAKNRKDSEYLCIQVACLLDRFVSACYDVVCDDGLYHGQPDEKGYSRVQVVTPSFEPEKLEVNWKSIPTNLLYEVLSYPLHIESSNSAIDSTFEYVAGPPDFSEGFEERQFRYAELGVKASELAIKLRKYGGLPEKESEDWDPIQHMKDKVIQIKERREKRYQQQEKMFQTLSG
ncbi:hypothetical protein [Hahella ganghwensis]|uniref:hypothetical protein n=1 Tax=Hahella ganghwensis TaxID=286420 RepID=UPI000370B079|nr:hypothetical protein [Hahella ganghwensis]